ncbi:fatty-acyl-CoA synthase [Rhodoligotrophos appendicifer]|uniref:fatty acyl-AMP ligase n=1 Tax=Rhodoligotrophos appendicifer TaxID=987056 RepID=UPI00195FD17A|nr:fatty acyl-AMP ligase [Rhodoligotrophos appendicifer]
MLKIADDVTMNGGLVGELANGANETRDLTKPTPRSNHDLPQKKGEFPTLADALDYAARGVTGFNFYSPRGQIEHALPYSRLRQRAIAVARRLLSLGLKRGDRVAVVAETTPDFVSVFYGCQYAGLIPCPMPYTMYIGGRDAYVDRVTGMLNSAAATAAIAPEPLLAYLREAGERAGTEIVLSHNELAALAPFEGELQPFAAHEDAYIQYSSGSTSHPKGVLISQAAIMNNIRTTVVHGMQITSADRAFSWLPLYHDMGLVGFCLTPMASQVTVDYLATPSFARRPALWLQLMSENRSTISFSPSFGYDLAARRINGQAVELDLSSWRIAGIGGDMVRSDILEFFAEKLEVAGFDARAFSPSYGMAETTLAIAISDCTVPIRVDVIDTAHYKQSRRAVPVDAQNVSATVQTRAFVVCGKPLPGYEVEVCDDEGIILGERQIGHIRVRGGSMMSGYFRNEDATAAVIDRNGWMSTGDMGYWLDGEIVITGRSKDLILHNGRNIWPQDIEWAVEQLPSLRSDDVAAFSVEGPAGEDEIIVLVQCRHQDATSQEALRREVAGIVRTTVGVDGAIVLVPPRSLPFTSSGKLSRAGAKLKYLTGEIAEISRGTDFVTGRVSVPVRAVAAE